MLTRIIRWIKSIKDSDKESVSIPTPKQTTQEDPITVRRKPLDDVIADAEMRSSSAPNSAGSDPVRVKVKEHEATDITHE